jgi:epoxide hydrolase
MNRLTRRDLLIHVGAAALLPAIATAAEGIPMDTITPFTIAISDEQIADLKERLTRTRYPHALTDD